MGELPSSEAIRTALGDLEMNVEDPVMVEAINPALSAPTSSSTIIADVPTFSTISNQPPQPPVLSSGMNSSYATTTNVPQLSSTIPQLSSGVPPLSSGTSTDIRLEDIELMIDSNYSGELRPSVENAIKRKWSRIVGPEFEIVVSINDANELIRVANRGCVINFFEEYFCSCFSSVSSMITDIKFLS